MGDLSIPDYVVIIAMQVFCTIAGLVLGRNKGTKEEKNANNTVENFVLGGRTMPPIPVGFSLVATTLSAVAMSGGLGEIYLYGLQYFLLKISAALSCLVALYFILPIFHQYPFISLNEYIGMRFSPSLRVVFTIIYLIGYMLYLGAVMYVPSQALSVVTGLPFPVSVVLAGALVIFYCFVGGMRVIIWTDALQLIFMMICFVVVIIQGSINQGGAEEVIAAAKRGERWQTFTLTESGSTRYSVWSIIANGFILTISTICASQAGVQRILCVQNMREVTITMYTSTIMTTLFAVLLAGAALSTYAWFEHCDPLLAGDIEHPDEILVYFVKSAIPSTSGVKGLAIGGIFCGSLSTLSSYINSFAAIAVHDLVKVMAPKWVKSERIGVILCKIFTLIFGLTAIGVTFLVMKLGGVTDMFQAVVGATGGPLLAVLCLGIFSNRINNVAAFVSMAIGLVLTVWIAVGSSISDIYYETLPLSKENCTNNANESSSDLFNYGNESFIKHYWFEVREYGVEPAFPIYRMSPLWYGPLGLLVSGLIGFVWSRFLDVDMSIDPRLLSPYILKSAVFNNDTNYKKPEKDAFGVVLTGQKQCYDNAIFNISGDGDIMPRFRRPSLDEAKISEVLHRRLPELPEHARVI